MSRTTGALSPRRRTSGPGLPGGASMNTWISQGVPLVMMPRVGSGAGPAGAPAGGGAVTTDHWPSGGGGRWGPGRWRRWRGGNSLIGGDRLPDERAEEAADHRPEQRSGAFPRGGPDQPAGAGTHDPTLNRLVGTAGQQDQGEPRGRDAK